MYQAIAAFTRLLFQHSLQTLFAPGQFFFWNPK